MTHLELHAAAHVERDRAPLLHEAAQLFDDDESDPVRPWRRLGAGRGRLPALPTSHGCGRALLTSRTRAAREEGGQ